MMPKSNGSSGFHRLPTNIQPTHYDLTIKPNLKDCTFTGLSCISVKVLEETNEIQLNAADLVIQEADLVHCETNQVVKSEKISEIVNEVVTLKFPTSLPAGSTYSLKLSFQGTLNDKLKGFYRSKYFSVKHQEDRFTATCHFEPTSARRAFPCWDEPLIKATFTVTLIAPNDLVTLCNTKIAVEAPLDNNLKSVTFEETPLMSTYLLAFVVGEFDHVEAIVNQGPGDDVRIRVYTPIGKSIQGQFALDFTTKALKYYNEYFDIKCNLKKIDLIAIPDFAIGAMENWGLVTFRETRLLIDPVNSSPAAKQIVALVVGHEISHFWFGNLVTMNWWTHLWLKEGFASFIMYLCTDYVYPEYSIWDQFVTDELACALSLDALHNSHPIEVPVEDPAQIGEIFDNISYAKGASIIKMLHKWLGDENFKKGLQIYLKKFSFKNAATEDLWQALEEASNKPVKSVMSTWTLQKGYPVVSVSQKPSSSPNSRMLSLKQEKFCSDNKIPENEKNTLWMIPLTLAKADNPTKVVIDEIFSTEASDLEVTDVKGSDWVKLNSGAVGVYRVQYSDEMINLLIPSVENKTLPPLDRLGLVNDSLALVSSGRISSIQLLQLLKSFTNEDNYAVWTAIDKCMSELGVVLSETDFYESFLNFGCSLYSKIHSKLGWEKGEKESHLDTLLRNLVICRLASCHDHQVTSKAKKLFDAHCAGTAIIPTDIRSSVYRAVALSSTVTEIYNKFLTLYRDTDLSEEKNRVSSSLGYFASQELIDLVITFSMSHEVRSQDTLSILASISRNSAKGREKVWNYFKSNLSDFVQRYEGSHLMWQTVKCLTENFSSEDKANEIQQYFEENNLSGVERSLQQALETIRMNANWLNRDGAAIKTFIVASF